MRTATITHEKTLHELKTIVEKNLEATLECGMALREIRDRKLYLEECGTFEEFCNNNWGVSKPRAYQLIDYALLRESLPSEKSTIVDTESAARELKKVDPAQRETVIYRAQADSGKVNAKTISQAAKAIKNEGVLETLDKTQFPIPEGSPAMSTWQRCAEIQQRLTALSHLRGTLVQAQENKDVMFSEVNFAAIIADLKSSYELLKVALPFAVCPSCQGRVLSPCSTCGGRGMVSEFYWKHKVAKEVKEIRERAVKLRRESK